MREIRLLDKLIDELAKGKALENSSANSLALESSLAVDRGGLSGQDAAMLTIARPVVRDAWRRVWQQRLSIGDAGR